MSEPEYIAQTAEPMTWAERREWFRQRGKDAADRGYTFVRYSVDRTPFPTMALVEAWKAQPEDQGEPRWQLSPLREGQTP